MQPYDEALVVATSDKARAIYAEAQRLPDAQYPVWTARTVYDYCAGLSWATSEARHLAELRQALGLPAHASPPLPPPTDTWPRLGASYYTSLTDPRVDPRAFAVRLADAGCTFTRVWLLDAWAIGASAGTGCYDGYLAWTRGSDGRFDLWHVSQPYLDRLRAYVEAMNAAGILPELSGLELYSWSSRKQGLMWVPSAVSQPFRFNRQGVSYVGDDALFRIAQPTAEDGFLRHFYRLVVQTLAGLAYAVELANEMPEKPLHERLRDSWRNAGYTGTISVNRHEDTPGQYANMKIGQVNTYERIAYHGKRDLSYLLDEYPDEPTYKTFDAFYRSLSYTPWRITLSSDGCRKSANVHDAYDYDALGAVAADALGRGCSYEHQSCLKLRGFTEGRIDLADLETDWLRRLAPLVG